jgi:hypothetical protein
VTVNLPDITVDDICVYLNGRTLDELLSDLKVEYPDATSMVIIVSF